VRQYPSGGSGGTFSLSVNYALDGSTGMNENIVLGNGQILQHRTIEGDGSNALSQKIGCAKGTISSDISSSGAHRSATSSYASGNLADSTQNVGVIGKSEIMISGSSGSLSASQKTGVLSGAMRSSQKISVQQGSVRSAQASEIAGALGYADGNARSSEDGVRVTGGLNGAGAISGQITTSASDGTSGSGVFRAGALNSKVYSAGKATSAGGDAYSYLSSNKQLVSSIRTRADEHVCTGHNLKADGDVLIFASTPDELKCYTAETISGSISTDSRSSQMIENDLAGDESMRSATSYLIPVPGSWVWNGYGGLLDSNPYMIEDDQGRDHGFAVGGNSALFDNIDGDWASLGGSLTSDPYAVEDYQGNIHVLARGADGALWDNVFDTDSCGTEWWGLGGYIKQDSHPSAALEPLENGFLKIVVRGGDDSLWIRDLDTDDMSGVWNTAGGHITSNPYIIFDNETNIHAFVRGGEGALWDLFGWWDEESGTYLAEWWGLGGQITSDPKPILDPNYNDFTHAYVRGGDGCLWDCFYDYDPENNTYYYYWIDLGGYISEGSSPDPISDPDGYIHVFVRGGDDALYDNAGWLDKDQWTYWYDWYGLGGQMTSGPSAIWDASEDCIDVAVGGADNSLWINTITDQPV